MAAAQYVNVPGYSALLLRQSFPDLNQPDALIPRSKEWWKDKAAWNSQGRRWTFPGGATITFGYLECDDDVYQYQGAAYQFIGIDELTQHTEFRYRYLFSRLRRLMGMPVPLRMRAGSNPGGRGHEWVKNRFIKNRGPGTVFIPAKLADNPSLDEREYVESLQNLDSTTRAQLLAGDWDAYSGGRFRREWFENHRYKAQDEGYQLARQYFVRGKELHIFLTVDTAASVRTSADYTVISVWGETRQHDLVWLDCYRDRIEVPDITPKIEEIYEQWNAREVHIEAVGAHSGKGIYQECKRRRMAAVPFQSVGDPLQRATEAIIMAETGRLWIPQWAPWLEDCLAELLHFTGDEKVDAHNDVVQTVSMAARKIMRNLHGIGVGPSVATTMGSGPRPTVGARAPVTPQTAKQGDLEQLGQTIKELPTRLSEHFK